METFHIFGTCVVNEHLSSKKFNKVKLKRLEFIKTLSLTKKGINAMSISDMTNIPRPTVVRKCKYLLKQDFLKINDKKQYELSSLNFKKVLPYQKEVFWYKAKFIRKILNLLVIS